MKKTYNIPECRMVNIAMPPLLVSSPANRYGDNEGWINYNPDAVSADDSD